MLQGQHFILGGLSRLTVRVMRILLARRARVTLLLDGAPEHDHLLTLVDEQVVRVEARGSLESILQQGGSAKAACILGLSNNDLFNLRLVSAAHAVNQHTPVVLRAFDPLLARELEQGMNVRRAFSVSALSAPVFVAVALGAEVLETLRLGDAELPICRIVVEPLSPLLGMTPTQIKKSFGCAVLAGKEPTGAWQSNPVETPCQPGWELVLGGTLEDVLGLARLNCSFFRQKPLPKRSPTNTRSVPRQTMLPRIALGLGALFVTAFVVFLLGRPGSWIDQLGATLNAAFGNVEVDDRIPDWVKLVECLLAMIGGAFLAVVFSHLASVATAERLEQRMGQRALAMRGHVVIAGLGNNGFRVSQLFARLGIPSTVVELAPNARFEHALRENGVVLFGDVRLPETLERAAIRDAVALVACTQDDLVNLQACLHARKLHPQIRTVCRIFDDQLADSLPNLFQIDAALSPSQVVADVFVEAATDALAMRVFQIGPIPFHAFRLTVERPITAPTVEQWRQAGIRLLGYRRGESAVHRPGTLKNGLQPGDRLILAGPADAILNLVRDLKLSSKAGDGSD